MPDQLVQTATLALQGTPGVQAIPERRAQMVTPEPLVRQVLEPHLEAQETPVAQGQTAIPGPPVLPGLGLRPEPQATPGAWPRQPTQIRPL